MLSNWATLELVAGDIPTARKKMDEALEIFERLRPDGHADVALALTNRAQIELAEGDFEAASRTLDRVADMGRVGLEGRGRATLIASMRTRIAWLRDGVPADAQAQLVELKRRIDLYDSNSIEAMLIDDWLAKLRR